jgi:hypothetical protein
VGEGFSSFENSTKSAFTHPNGHLSIINLLINQLQRKTTLEFTGERGIKKKHTVLVARLD